MWSIMQVIVLKVGQPKIGHVDIASRRTLASLITGIVIYCKT